MVVEKACAKVRALIAPFRSRSGEGACFDSALSVPLTVWFVVWARCVVRARLLLYCVRDARCRTALLCAVFGSLLSHASTPRASRY
jgi:hypothetical protein